MKRVVRDRMLVRGGAVVAWIVTGVIVLVDPPEHTRLNYLFHVALQVALVLTMVCLVYMNFVKDLVAAYVTGYLHRELGGDDPGEEDEDVDEGRYLRAVGDGDRGQPWHDA